MKKIIKLLLVLSMYSKKVNVLFVGWCPINKVKKFLISILKCRIYVLSRETLEYLKKYTSSEIIQLKAGVDTKKFVTVSEETKRELRKKYHFSDDEKIILHVGHLKKGRGVETMLELDDQYTPLLIASTSTSQEDEIRKLLETKKKFRIIDDYIPNIEEIYQLSDLYLFPVAEKGNCIDSPLSVFEAASCGLPVVTTKYGELNAFVGEKGFTFIDESKKESINKEIENALSNSDGKANEKVFEYDWNEAISQLSERLA